MEIKPDKYKKQRGNREMVVRDTNDISTLDEIMCIIELLADDAGTDNILDIVDSIEFTGNEKEFFNMLEEKQVITGKFLDNYEEFSGDIEASNSIHIESLYGFISSERPSLEADKVIEYIAAKYMEQTGDGIESLYSLLASSYIWDEGSGDSIEIEVEEHQEYKYLV